MKLHSIFYVLTFFNFVLCSSEPIERLKKNLESYEIQEFDVSVLKKINGEQRRLLAEYLQCLVTPESFDITETLNEIHSSVYCFEILDLIIEILKEINKDFDLSDPDATDEKFYEFIEMLGY